MPRLNIDVSGDTTTLPDVKIPVVGDVDSVDKKVQEIEVHTDMTRITEKAAALAFFEEPVVIHLHESSNPQDELYVFCAVNGEGAQPGNPWLKRGKQHTIKRKFVANLLTAKTISFTQPYKGDLTDKSNYMRPQSAVKYPFSIVKDSPQGMKWAQQLMGG